MEIKKETRRLNEKSNLELESIEQELDDIGFGVRATGMTIQLGMIISGFMMIIAVLALPFLFLYPENWRLNLFFITSGLVFLFALGLISEEHPYTKAIDRRTKLKKAIKRNNQLSGVLSIKDEFDD